MDNDQVDPVHELHFTVAQLAQSWRVGTNTIRRIFAKEPGVLRLNGSNQQDDGKRKYVSLRIPQSVAERVYRRASR